MSQKLLIATRNSKKKRELQEILGEMDLQLLTLDEIKDIPEIEEDGQTFEENAIKKAFVTADLSAFITMADDSGLVVDALDGQPGIYSARFAGPDADDEKNNEKLLNLMRDIPEGERTARFVCVIAICTPDGITRIAEGKCEGKIALVPSGKGGFGYDPLFIPLGFEKSFAELDAAQKNQISHRGQALKLAAPIIKDILEK